jgi:hypothetical protein
LGRVSIAVAKRPMARADAVLRFTGGRPRERWFGKTEQPG